MSAREDRSRIERLKEAIRHATDHGLNGPEAFDAFVVSLWVAPRQEPTPLLPRLSQSICNSVEPLQHPITHLQHTVSTFDLINEGNQLRLRKYVRCCGVGI